MNGTGESLAQARAIAAAHPEPRCEVLLCPPATLVARMAEALRGSSIAIGGQDCHPEEAGAHTGDVAAAMLAEAGATHVIVGHSERRADHGETDALVRAKAEAALRAGLVPIVCLGETEAERAAGRTLDVVGRQLAGSIPAGGGFAVAYEPVWAIGTGKVAGPAEIAEVHAALRAGLAERIGAEAAAGVPLLYGGSVKGSNAAEIFAVQEVDGALVGGASLTAEAFSPIIAALEAAGMR